MDVAAGARHFGVVPLGAVPGAAELRHLPDHAAAAVQVPDEEPAGGGHRRRHHQQHHHAGRRRAHAVPVRRTPLVRGVGNQDVTRDRSPYHEAQQDRQGLMNSDPMHFFLGCENTRFFPETTRNWQIHRTNRL
jgi:hypothetical protein